MSCESSSISLCSAAERLIIARNGFASLRRAELLPDRSRDGVGNEPATAVAHGDIHTALVTAAAAQVTLMQKENRGPTDAEKADQTARLTALDANYDKAAGNK